MTIIEAASAGTKSMADDTLRLSVDVEPRFANDAFALFGKRGTPLVLAALRTAAQKEPEASKPKGGEMSKWLGMRCNEPEFQTWIIAQAIMGLGQTKVTSLLARALCEVESRAEIDNDPAAMERFQERIRKPWAASRRTQLEPTA